MASMKIELSDIFIEMTELTVSSYQQTTKFLQVFCKWEAYKKGNKP